LFSTATNRWGAAAEVREPSGAYGFLPFAAGEHIVSNETIDELRDRDGV
jgi:hypothetical protein